MCNKQWGLMALSSLMLAACATAPMSSGNWQAMGESVNGNVAYFLDANSVRKTGQLVEYREEERIKDIHAEHFADTPPYQVAVNRWQVDCRAKTHRLLATQLYDGSRRLIASHEYGTTGVRTRAVAKGSAAEWEMQQVCR